MAGLASGVGTLSTVAAFEIPDEIMPGAIGRGQTFPKLPPSRTSSITVSIETIIMSALIFIGILAWFEFLRTTYEVIFSIDGSQHYDYIFNRFGYAIFITVVVIVLLYVLFRFAEQNFVEQE